MQKIKFSTYANPIYYIRDNYTISSCVTSHLARKVANQKNLFKLCK